MNKLNGDRYRVLLTNYYQKLSTPITDNVARKHGLDRHSRRCGSVLSAVSKLPSPQKEVEFVRAILAQDGPSLSRAA